MTATRAPLTTDLRRRPRQATFAAPMLLVSALIAQAMPAEAYNESSTAAIRKALRFLQVSQVKEPLELTIGDVRVRDYPGNWPQRRAPRRRRPPNDGPDPRRVPSLP